MSTTLTVDLTPRLKTAIAQQAAQRHMTVDHFVNQVLADFVHEVEARTHGLQPRPEPPRRPERSTVIVPDPEGRIRDAYAGRTWQSDLLDDQPSRKGPLTLRSRRRRLAGLGRAW